METYRTTQEKNVIERALRGMRTRKNYDYSYYGHPTTQYVTNRKRKFDIAVNITEMDDYNEICVVGTVLDPYFSHFVKSLKERIPPQK
jgi:hypothetical protein